jgi:assimilatory nitrate reductase catalytic subunit
MLTREALSSAECRALLAGGMPDGAQDSGPVVCVCHQVGAARVAKAISEGCHTAEAVGRASAAGTNCGSCLPEINRMLAAGRPRAPDTEKHASNITETSHIAD